MSQQKTILGMIVSPRKLGNCEIFVKELWRHVPGESTLRLLRLTDLDIRPCRACYACIMGEECPLVDHTAFLKEQIRSADALLIAAPVYFLGAHSMVKRILDRGFLFYEDAERNAHKPCILVNFFGIEEKMGVAPQTLRALAGVLCLDVQASVNLMAALPGEVLREQRNLDLAENLGAHLFSEDKRSGPEGCPYCGCEIVRMQRQELICTLCHGSFTLDAKGKPLKAKSGWEIGTVSFVHEHSAWLKGMKDNYMAVRKELLRLTLPYKNIGTWIEPPKSK
ncbi:MAG TPA: NAD(P)H-dependent oxidoreductase [Syntrophorhabdales bacterium]|nr:NAD(P)H-dependent oxidoreductase [Syntrophorhabdales bacterium]